MKLWVLMVCCALASLANAQGWICAEGGGTGSGPWAAEMYGWMAEKGGNGHVVLLGAVELDDKPDPREAAFVKAGAKSARSLVITADNADTQETFDAINEASIIFIRGGSQSRYVEWWKGTKTEAAIRAVFARGGVVGGTSAGCAILGEVSYDARNGSLRPEEIVKDARHPDLTLTKDFLGLVPGVLFDTHFGERARLPRLAVMLGHCREDLKVEPIGIGLDPKTALCIGPDGMAEVRGEGYATFLELSPGAVLRLDAGNPPGVGQARMSLAKAGARFDVRKRALIDAPNWSGQRPLTISLAPRDFSGALATPMPERQTPAEAVLARVQQHGSLVLIRDPYGAPNAVMKHVHELVFAKGGVCVLVGEGGNVRLDNSMLINNGNEAIVVVSGLSGRRPGPHQLLRVFAPGWEGPIGGLLASPPTSPPAP